MRAAVWHCHPEHALIWVNANINQTHRKSVGVLEFDARTQGQKKDNQRPIWISNQDACSPPGDPALDRWDRARVAPAMPDRFRNPE
jgi:hypothetical protein